MTTRSVDVHFTSPSRARLVIFKSREIWQLPQVRCTFTSYTSIDFITNITVDLEKYINLGSQIVKKITKNAIDARRKFVLTYTKTKEDNGLTSFFLSEYLAKQMETLEPTEIQYAIDGFKFFLHEIVQKFGAVSKFGEMSNPHASAHYYLAKMNCGSSSKQHSCVEGHLRIAAGNLHPEGLIEYAKFLESKNRHKDALSVWKKALVENGPDDKGFILNRIGCIIDMVDPIEAHGYFAKSAELGDEASIANLDMYDKEGKPILSSSESEAVEVLAEILPLVPANAPSERGSDGNKRSLEEDKSDSQDPKRQKTNLSSEEEEAENPSRLSPDDIKKLTTGKQFHDEIIRAAKVPREKLRRRIVNTELNCLKNLIYKTALDGLNVLRLNADLLGRPRYSFSENEINSMVQMIQHHDILRLFSVDVIMVNRDVVFEIRWTVPETRWTPPEYGPLF